nr:MAG TPA: hypothetical protein [Caudoviricetes sp.]
MDNQQRSPEQGNAQRLSFHKRLVKIVVDILMG